MFLCLRSPLPVIDTSRLEKAGEAVLFKGSKLKLLGPTAAEEGGHLSWAPMALVSITVDIQKI
jgi:hypothetical protein